MATATSTSVSQQQQMEERLSTLDMFPVEDDQCVSEAPSASVHLDCIVDPNFQDRNAFETKWTQETFHIQKIQDALNEGDKYINMLYTYRSCSYPISQLFNTQQTAGPGASAAAPSSPTPPPPPPPDESTSTPTEETPKASLDQTAVYEAQFAVLEPEIKKLREFMYFHRSAIKLFCENVKRISLARKESKGKSVVASESILVSLIKMLDLFALLDALKNMKACLNNDFSFYKRAMGYLRKNLGADDQNQENHTLYLFLAHQNAVTASLKDELKELEGVEDVIGSCINVCAERIEKERYLLPNEKHMFLRVMPFALFLIDSDSRDAFRSKVINSNMLKPIFKKYPVVTVYGDMQVTLETFVRKAPHYDPSWFAYDARIQQEYELVHIVSQIREKHNEYLERFTQVMQDYRKAKSTMATGVPLPQCKEIFNTVLQGLQLLADWSGKIQQQAAWKYSAPNRSPDIDAKFDYEKVVRYNYTSAERFALIEVISMLKGVAGILIKQESVLSSPIRLTIHDELQDFIQNSLREMIRLVSQAKSSAKPSSRPDLLQLRTLAADWTGGTEPVDTALYGKKEKRDTAPATYPTRAVPPSATQMELLRNLVFSLAQQKKEFSGTMIKQLEEFYARSFFYPYLIDLSGTILKTTDLADLWYREFYLELNHQLQFPIEMSLPWILVDHVLESKDANQEVLEYTLFPFDIYNDAANRALHTLKQQFLYNEIEAEVNLCFDQLLYKLSEQMYSFYKTQASSVLLDKVYKAALEPLTERKTNSSEMINLFDKLNPPRSRYEPLLQQRHFQLLGRSVNLSALVAQRLNTYLRQNVDYAISRFESADLTAITELESQLKAIHMTHTLISRHVDVDPWSSIMNEMNESTSLVSYHSRILLHCFFELVYDFCPNYNFNTITQRFVKSPRQFAPAPTRDAAPKPNIVFLWGNRQLNNAYQNIFEMHKKFFGQPHLMSMINLIGRAGLPLIVGECLRHVDLKLKNVIAPYVDELFQGTPISGKLPLHSYGVGGSYLNFEAKLKEVYTYGDFKNEVLQELRDFGNHVLFLLLLDDCLKIYDTTTFAVWAPVMGITPPVVSKGVPLEPSESDPLVAVLAKFREFLAQGGEAKSMPSMDEDCALAQTVDQYYRQWTQQISLFKGVLMRIDETVNSLRNEWCHKDVPENGVMQVETTHEFYRFWSCILFALCMPQKDGEQMHELYGDGILWAGSTLVHLLGQKERFNAFDFTYHILATSEDPPFPIDTNQFPDVLGFLGNARTVKELNSTVFDILDEYFPIIPVGSEEGPFRVVLHPPSAVALSQWSPPAAGTGMATRPITTMTTAAMGGGGGGDDDEAAPPPPPHRGGSGSDDEEAPPPPPPRRGDSGPEGGDEDEDNPPPPPPPRDPDEPDSEEDAPPPPPPRRT